jgi:hypothetical protein
MVDNDEAPLPRDDAMQALIGKQLRSLYESVLAEPLPDKIVDLLVKLDDIPAPQIEVNGRRSTRSEPQ